ncbi:copper chaperone PCu(A)C [Neptunomonas sp.]|uniref:copper chaperone PCu(A)C n=1 Tax=Neptunomonas sp. TaxID=1971898 RepID=UPI003568FCDD
MKKLLLSSALLLASHFALADVNVESAYVRAVPPGQMNSAAFMQLKNEGPGDISLVAAKSQAAKNAELHTHTQDNGVMRMRQVSEISLPAGEVITLQPGGMHIMLIGLTQNLAAGENISLSLEFSDGSQQALEVPVEGIMPMEKMGTMMHEQKHITQ